MSANSGVGANAANAADPVVRLREAPVAAPARPEASSAAGAGGSSLFSWVTHPVEAFGAFRGMLSKKPKVEINEDFLESMQGVTNLQNPSIEKLLEKYSDSPDMVKSIAERKFAGVRARYQLINLISSMLQYLAEYRKARSTPLLQISATEDLLDDLLLYLVYLYEKDVATKNVQDKLRGLGGRAIELRGTMSQNMAPSFVEAIFGRPQARYQIPAEFNEALNTFLDLNAERTQIWGLARGSGVRERSGFPFLAGTDDDELDLEGLNAVMAQYLQMARAIEKRKVRVLGDTNYKTGSPTDNAEKLASLERTLEHLSTRPDLEAVLHFGPSRTNGRGAAAAAAAATANANSVGEYTNGSVRANNGANANGRRNPHSQQLNRNSNVPPVFNATNATQFSFGGVVNGSGGPTSPRPAGKRPLNNANNANAANAANAAAVEALLGIGKKPKMEGGNRRKSRKTRKARKSRKTSKTSKSRSRK